jgi:hypothetical protein
MNKSGLFILIASVALSIASIKGQDSPDNFLEPYRPDIVTFYGIELGPFNSEKFITAPYFVLYFEAGWSLECQKFSPLLMKAYHCQQHANKRFEVLVLPVEKSEDDMIGYMRSQRIKLPAVAFNRFGKDYPLWKFYSGNGIPCITVVDANGTLLLQSKNDQDAPEILKQLQILVKSK